MADKYRPSNGSEGMEFQTRFCDRCDRDQFNPETGHGDSCKILLRALTLDIDHPDYPAEWTYDKAGRPTCTALLVDEDPQYRCERTVDMFG